MGCAYDNYIEKLLDGKLNETREEELLQHAESCTSCSERLKRIAQIDDFVKAELSTYKGGVSTNDIMTKIVDNKSLIPLLYRTRKFIIVGAAAICVVFLAYMLKPFSYISNGYVGLEMLEDTQNNIQGQAGEFLYGKYPEEILKVIADRPGINKDYRLLTKEDLKTIRDFYVINRNLNQTSLDKKYGFQYNSEYDFSILLDMPNLENLDIDLGDSIRLKDYSVLEKLSNLKKLTIGNVKNDDMVNTAGLSSLEELYIYNGNITNIDFIKNLDNLTSFTLNNTPGVSDFTGLKYGKNLKQVSLINMRICEENLSTIPDMNKLESLSLYNNNIKYLNQFPLMQSLKLLTLDNNPLESINVASNWIPSIKELSLCNTVITGADRIKGFENIETIDISGTRIRSVRPFMEYRNLKNINAGSQTIDDANVLKDTGINLLTIQFTTKP